MGSSERAGGVPLFVEEVTRLLLERGEQGGAQAILLDLAAIKPAARPRPGWQKLRRGGAGDGGARARFHLLLPREVCVETDEPALQAYVGANCRRRPLIRRGRATEGELSFQARTLVQDAAYDSLLKSHRQALHRRAAESFTRQRVARARGDRASFH